MKCLRQIPNEKKLKAIQGQQFIHLIRIAN